VNIEAIRKILITHEGMELKPYIDTVGKTTIGVGRNLDDNGISEEEALCLLDNDIKNTISDLENVFDNFNELPDKIKLVMIDMMFNLGIYRFKKFKNMIAAVKARDWENVINEMKDSKWCRQLKGRCEYNASLINDYIQESKTI